MIFFQLILSLFFFSACFATAEVEWEREEIMLVVHPTQRIATAEFKFYNSGKKSVEFLSIRPSCGCLSIHPQKKWYQPGESGTLKVMFDLANRIGFQEKSVKIITSDNPTRRQKLIVKVNIPEAYRFSTTHLLWKKNHREAQVVSFVNVSGQPISVGRVISSNEHLRVELKMIREGFEYQLKLTPDLEVGNVCSVVRIETVPLEGQKESKDYRIFVRIE